MVLGIPLPRACMRSVELNDLVKICSSAKLKASEYSWMDTTRSAEAEPVLGGCSLGEPRRFLTVQVPLAQVTTSKISRTYISRTWLQQKTWEVSKGIWLVYKIWSSHRQHVMPYVGLRRIVIEALWGTLPQREMQFDSAASSGGRASSEGLPPSLEISITCHWCG